MYLILSMNMFEFWSQNLVQLTYDMGAKFQTYVSKKEIGTVYVFILGK